MVSGDEDFVWWLYVGPIYDWPVVQGGRGGFGDRGRSTAFSQAIRRFLDSMSAADAVGRPLPAANSRAAEVEEGGGEVVEVGVADERSAGSRRVLGVAPQAGGRRPRPPPGFNLLPPKMRKVDDGEATLGSSSPPLGPVSPPSPQGHEGE